MAGFKEELYIGCTMGDLANRALSRFPDRVALATENQEFTYSELADAVSQMIQVLKSHGLNRGDGLVVLSANRPDLLFVTLAATIMGLRWSALHPLGSDQDHVFLLKDAEASALVIDAAAFAERGRSLQSAVPTLKAVLTLGAADFGGDITAEAAKQQPQTIQVEAQPEDIYKIQYTGGTTGQPKGAARIHHREVVLTTGLFSELDWPQEVRFLASTPISHAAGMFFLPVLMRGGTYYIEPRFDPARFVKSIKKNRITATLMVPTMIYTLLNHPEIVSFDLSSLGLIVYGAAPMSPQRIADAQRIFGPVFNQVFGQTEAPFLTVLRKDDHNPNNLEKLASCGTPISGVNLKILDDDHQEVPPGVIGEICIRSPLVMDRYWKRPEETTQAFRGDWLHTGDMARRDEAGYVYIVDRAKDMIISGGFNVYPREIEDVLAQHPAVSMSAVIGVPDEKWGEVVKAVVVLKPKAKASAEELMAFVQDRKGKVYAPKSVDFTDLIPVTPIGKPDKKALRAMYWQGEERQVH